MQKRWFQLRNKSVQHFVFCEGRAMKLTNRHDTRESWLRAATDALRPTFAETGYPLPDRMRFAIAFPSTGRAGRRVGECWHSSTSADEHFELIVRADIAEPLEVLGILVHELLHAALPADAGHGKLYREGALKLGLEGPMRHAMPGERLTRLLVEIVEKLGPLPHAQLHIERGRENRPPADRPKKQKARMHKAECEGDGCGYTVRVASKWVRDLGPPHCPKHGAMHCELPPDDAEDGGEAPTEALPPVEVEGLRESV